MKIISYSIIIFFFYHIWAVSLEAKNVATNLIEHPRLVSTHIRRENALLKPILWQLVNPVDGSKHPIFGTSHRMNMSLLDLPLEVQAAILSADTLIGELLPRNKDTSGLDGLSAKPARNFINPVLSYYRKKAGDDDLPTQLGEKYWRTLQGIFKDRKTAIKDAQPIMTLLHMGLKHQDAQIVIGAMRALATKEAYAGDSFKHTSTLDMQIANNGLAAGKNLVGLETYAELEQRVKQYRTVATEHLQSLDHNGDILVEILKNIIDMGGINYLRDRSLEARTAYLEGNVLRALSLLHPFILDPYFDEIMLDQRNLAWIEGGKIQDLCWADNRCFIFIGFAHLFKDKHPLIKLLREQGFEVTAIAPDELELEQDAHTLIAQQEAED